LLEGRKLGSDQFIGANLRKARKEKNIRGGFRECGTLFVRLRSRGVRVQRIGGARGGEAFECSAVFVSEREKFFVGSGTEEPEDSSSYEEGDKIGG